MTGVAHVIDALLPGGAERVAVNLINHLPRDRYRPFLITTRSEGLLIRHLHDHVERFCLNRASRYDASALWRLIRLNREHKIRILHAHGSSLFLAAVSSLFAPHPAVIWHAHYGRLAIENRHAPLHRLASNRLAGVIAVNEGLAGWCRRRLRIRPDRVWYVPNTTDDPRITGTLPALPIGTRVVCVANFREEKDHITLIRAIKFAQRKVPEMQLILVGAALSHSCTQAIQGEVESLDLSRNVTWLGPRDDIGDILHSCDIGVLSSASEGLPMSLLEYGAAGLATACTDVGQCGDVLDNGRAGILVPPRSPEQLGTALTDLALSPELRVRLGSSLRTRVEKLYTPDAVLQHICSIYETILEPVQ